MIQFTYKDNDMTVQVTSTALSAERLLCDFKKFMYFLGYHASTIAKVQLVEADTQQNLPTQMDLPL